MTTATATSATDRAAIRIAIADRLQAHLEQIAVLESRENGKPRHYQEVKNVLVNHDPKPLGFFV